MNGREVMLRVFILKTITVSLKCMVVYKKKLVMTFFKNPTSQIAQKVKKKITFMSFSFSLLHGGIESVIELKLIPKTASVCFKIVFCLLSNRFLGSAFFFNQHFFIKILCLYLKRVQNTTHLWSNLYIFMSRQSDLSQQLPRFRGRYYVTITLSIERRPAYCWTSAASPK